MFLKNRNISSKIKRSKVTDYAALITIYTINIWTDRQAYANNVIKSDIIRVYTVFHSITTFYSTHVVILQMDLFEVKDKSNE